MDTEQSIKKIIEKVGLSREEIKKRIDKTVKDLSGLIDEEGALTIVAKELGVNLKENQEAANIIPDQLISQIQPNSYVSIVGRIEEIEDRRTYNRKDGTQGAYFIFALRDKSGVIRCIVWDQNLQILNEPGFAKNEIIRIVNGLIKASKNGGNEIHIGNKSKIQLSPDNVDYNNIPPVQERQLILTKIAELNINTQSVNIQCEVISIFPPKEYTKKDNTKGRRASLVVKDGDAQTFITFWDDSVIKIENISVNDSIQITKLRPKKNFRDESKIDLTASSSSEITILKKSGNSGKNNQEIQLISIQELVDKKIVGIIEGIIQDIENPRAVKMKDGTTKNVQSLIIADETAALKINLWGDQINPDLKVNDVIRITNLYTKMNNFSQQNEGNLSTRSTIEKISKKIQTTHTIALNGLKSADSKNNQEIQLVTIQELTDKNLNGIIEGIIQDIESPRVVKMKDGTTKNVQSLVIADETAALKVNLWGDQIIPDLKINDVIRITNIYVKNNNFSKQIEGNLSIRSSIEKISKQIQTTHTLSLKSEFSGEKNSSANVPTQSVSIDQINSDALYEFNAVIGRDFKQISFFQSCNRCKKKPVNCTCEPPKEFKDRMIVNLSVEDETKIIRIAFFSEQAEKLLGEPTEKVKEIYESDNKTEYLKNKNSELMGRAIYVKGRAKFSQATNTYDLNVISFEFINIEAETEQLINMLNVNP